MLPFLKDTGQVRPERAANPPAQMLRMVQQTCDPRYSAPCLKVEGKYRRRRASVRSRPASYCGDGGAEVGATGYNMLGTSPAPAAGKLIAESMQGHPPTLIHTLSRPKGSNSGACPAVGNLSRSVKASLRLRSGAGLLQVFTKSLGPVLHVIIADRVDHRQIARLTFFQRHVECNANGVTEVIGAVRIDQHCVT